MKNKRTLLVILLAAGVLLAVGAVSAQPERSASMVPTVVSYQGQVTIGGAPFNGQGVFQFAIVDAGGAASYWSNDGASVNGSQPAGAVPLNVSNGLFTVLLGDTSLPGMTQPLTAAAFGAPERYLRVWFSPDNVVFTQLSPDRRIASVPYALQAEQAADAARLGGLLPGAFQKQVNQGCAVGSSIRAVHADGTVVCEQPTTPYYPLLQAQSVDLAAVDDALRGFRGGFTDGRYAYFVPFSNLQQTIQLPAGKVARLDLNNFTTGGVTVLDLMAIDPELYGFAGGFTDGRYGYFVPSHFFMNNDNSGKLVRVDLQNFSPSGVTVLDLMTVDPHLGGFAGGFTDGRYGYLVPLSDGYYFGGVVARVDLQNFSASGVTALDPAAVDFRMAGFWGGYTDGRYAYFCPDTYPLIVRVDLKNFTASGVQSIDLDVIGPRLFGLTGAFTDGRFGYFVPLYNSGPSSKVIRVDQQNFTTGGVTILDVAEVNPDLYGFIGGFSDGHYGYLVPQGNTYSLYSGRLVRFDLNNFTPAGVTWIDLAADDPDLKGFMGGFTDGRYGYLVPSGGGHLGKVARIQLFSGSGVP